MCTRNGQKWNIVAIGEGNGSLNIGFRCNFDHDAVVWRYSWRRTSDLEVWPARLPWECHNGAAGELGLQCKHCLLQIIVRVCK
jgi:hypothetical protein